MRAVCADQGVKSIYWAMYSSPLPRSTERGCRGGIRALHVQGAERSIKQKCVRTGGRSQSQRPLTITWRQKRKEGHNYVTCSLNMSLHRVP